MADVSSGASQIHGTRAHDAADGDNPVKVGQVAVAHGSNPTAVAAADRTDWYANRHGVPFIIGGHPNAVTTTALILDSDGAQTNAAIVTVSGGTKIVVTRLSVIADADNTGTPSCVVGFAAATLATPGTTGGAGLLMQSNGLIAGGGFTIGNGSGIIGVGADGEDLRYSCQDPAGGAITIAVTYFTIES